MNLSKMRYSLTEHMEKYIYTFDNFKLLIHPSAYDKRDILNKLEDDIELMPEIEKTPDNIDIKFYRYDYNENLYSKSELLAFIFASISGDWDILKGIDLNTGLPHFWLKQDNLIYDPSLAIVTPEEKYLKWFKPFKKINKEEIPSYISEHNNLCKFYERGLFKKYRTKKKPHFSYNFINKLIDKFNKNIDEELLLDEERAKHVKEYFMLDDFMELRQVLSQKRKSFLKSANIAVHPSIDESILSTIEPIAKTITNLLKQEYNLEYDYYQYTLGNCYILSIMFNLFDGSFKLVQGGIPYQKHGFNITTEHFYQHSWLEKDGIVYDPALRIIVPSHLYYKFVRKDNVYSKEETENILRRIGGNFTHFKDYMDGLQIGNNESISYRFSINKIDSPEMKKEGERLISLVKAYKCA